MNFIMLNTYISGKSNNICLSVTGLYHLRIISSIFIHVVTYCRISIFFFLKRLNCIQFFVYATFSLSTYFFIFRCFHILATVNSSIMNTEMLTSLWNHNFTLFGWTSKNRITGSYNYLIFILWNTTILFSVAAMPFCISTNSIQGF